jgi:hypothetical protein
MFHVIPHLRLRSYLVAYTNPSHSDAGDFFVIACHPEPFPTAPPAWMRGDESKPTLLTPDSPFRATF